MAKLDSTLLLLGALALTGCSGGPPADSDELIGEANLAVTNAPADANCLRVKVVGSRTVPLLRLGRRSGGFLGPITPFTAES